MHRKLLRLLAILSLCLIALGSYVRATGAGLSCPDWPLCLGRAIPEFTYGVTQEVIHRYLAGGAIVLTFLILKDGFQVRRENPGLFTFSAVLMLLVLVQAVFGGLTVALKLNPFIVTTHLALGTIFFKLFAPMRF